MKTVENKRMQNDLGGYHWVMQRAVTVGGCQQVYAHAVAFNGRELKNCRDECALLLWNHRQLLRDAMDSVRNAN